MSTTLNTSARKSTQSTDRAKRSAKSASTAAKAGRPSGIGSIPGADYPISRFTLANGLRVVLAPDTSSGVVGVAVHYDVGFRSEPEGRTGFAHLFEHLMFQGSESLPKLEHFRLVQSSGGIFNGSTHTDYTDYFEVLPAAALERGLFLEADRMRAPNITAENLANQVDVVSEEIRLNVLNRPYGGFPWIDLPPVLFDSFANAHNGYGDFVDLNAATVADCADFFESYYTPANAVLTVCGDFELARAGELISRHFDDVPHRSAPVRPSFDEPWPTSVRRAEKYDSLAPAPAFAVGWRLPDPVADLPGYLAHVLLGHVLSDGESSRLQSAVVAEAGLATEIWAGPGLMGGPLDARDPDVFVLGALHAVDMPADTVIDAAFEQIAALASDGPSEDERRRAIARFTAGLYRENDSISARTRSIGSLELLHGRAELLGEIPGLLDQVSTGQIASAAASLDPNVGAILTIVPGGKPVTAAKKSGNLKSGKVKSSRVKPSGVKSTNRRPTAAQVGKSKAKSGKAGADRAPTKKREQERGKQSAAKRPAVAHVSRTAEQIAVTPIGSRPLPELTAARAVSHPELLTETVSNGLRIIAVRKPGTPLVEVRLRVPFGGTAASHSARSELLAATLLLGTASRSREQVDAELAMVGGHLEASVDPQRFAITGSVLSNGLPVLLEILAESLVEPALRRHDVLGERDRLVEHLAIAASQPAVVARHHLQEVRFGTHPVTRELPDPAAVGAVGVAALRGLLRKSLVPNGSTLVLVGQLDPAEAIALVESALANWISGETATAVRTPPAVVGAPVKGFHRDGAVQSQIRLTAGALVRTDPDYAAGQLANLIYGGYFSSRLVENIREDKGYTYSAHSNFEFWPGRAAVTVSFDTTTPSTAAALLEARYELGRLALAGPTAKEVESARNYALGTLATSLATQAGYASTLSTLAGLGLEVDWVREHPERLAAVTDEDVARVASTLLAPAAYTGVVVGDLDAIGPSLATVGGVEL